MSFTKVASGPWQDGSEKSDNKTSTETNNNNYKVYLPPDLLLSVSTMIKGITKL